MVVVVADEAATVAVVGVVRPLKAVVTTATPVKMLAAAATMAVARAPPTRVSHAKTQATVQAVALVTVARHAASVARKARAHRAMTNSHASRAMKCSARTLAARVSTWATSPIILMTVNPPAMCLLAFRHPGCQRAVEVVAAGAAIGAAAVVVVVVTLAAVARAQEAVAAAIQAADSGADRSA